MMEAKAQTLVGAGLTTIPVWLETLHAASSLAGDIAAILGLLIAIHGAYRIVRGYLDKRRKN